MDPEGKTEEALAAELEAMYQRVASLDRPYEELQPTNVIRSQQEPFEPWTDATVETAQPAPAEPPSPQTSGRAPSSGGDRRPFPVAALVFAGLCVVLLGVFFWPTLYDVSSIRTGDESYPIRMNRITGRVAYYDGGQWRPGPVPVAARSVLGTLVPAPSAHALLAPVPTPLVAASPPSESGAVRPERQVFQDRRWTPAAPQTPSAFHQMPAPAPKIVKKELFAIQIQSFDHPDDARKLVADLERTGMEAYIVAAPLGNRGVWNRVLIGRFESPGDALNFMQEKKLKDRYPDSFIQKLSR
jgi:hypothetical protein